MDGTVGRWMVSCRFSESEVPPLVSVSAVLLGSEGHGVGPGASASQGPGGGSWASGGSARIQSLMSIMWRPRDGGGGPAGRVDGTRGRGDADCVEGVGGLC